MNKKNYKELENEKTRGKKRYLERINEASEAEKDIKNYEREVDVDHPERGTDDRGYGPSIRS